MKRLIAAGIIIVFILSLCICSNIYVNRICDQTVADIEQYYQDCIFYDSSEASLQNLEKNWSDRKDILGLFVNHGFLDEISLYLTELPILAKSEDNTQLLLACEDIKALTEQIRDEQKLALHSFY